MRTCYFLLLLSTIGTLARAQNFSIELFSSGFNQPLDIQNAGDDRLFIVEKNGLIKIVNGDGTVPPSPFVDISTKIDPSGEGGLLGLAFHPDYSNNGYFYVNYVDLNRDLQISRFSVSPGDGNIADPNSELPILNYEHDNVFHYGGTIGFGPDGYFYISTGDDLSSDNAQNTTNLKGKILRLDVDNPSGGNNYGIPPDNPFAGSTTESEEIWAYGLRNPWKFSFDVPENTIWIADVGESTVEEINRVSIIESGYNFGWPCYEGSMPHSTLDCPPVNELEFPLAEYTHDIGFAIIGGYVYRGTSFPDFYGSYLFADIGSDILGWVDESEAIHFTQPYGRNWSSLGVDFSGEIYLAAFTVGEIYKLDLQLSIPQYQEHEVFLFPKQTKMEFSIKLKEHVISSVTILDLHGRKLWSTSGNSSSDLSIKLPLMDRGVYFVKIEDISGNVSLRKIVLE